MRFSGMVRAQRVLDGQDYTTTAGAWRVLVMCLGHLHLWQGFAVFRKKNHCSIESV